jgi:hypothetical protein
VVLERDVSSRKKDLTFFDIMQSCQFLAKYHHNENNLKTLSERFTNLLSYGRLVEMTSLNGEFNATYGSSFPSDTQNIRFPKCDWIDDYNKTGSYLEKVAVGENETFKYTYNLGQRHAIDDFDEESVWFYITMVSPIEELESVVELEDIMPYVFWWDNRGSENNGDTAICYGKSSSAKLNYEEGGWCHSTGCDRLQDEVWLDENNKECHKPIVDSEQRWHAVAETLGVDFSNPEHGGAIVTSDNSGNVYKGAFDPNCAGTDEKWKIHKTQSPFGTNQGEDLVEDKYFLGEEAHGKGNFNAKVNPPSLNEPILSSIENRPMTWNLWNVVRHYAYIKYFKNRNKSLGKDAAQWYLLEEYTKKLVKGIYRTFKDKQHSTFGQVDETPTNYGKECNVPWTNSFIEVSAILERNAREHQGSLVLFTGDVPMPTSQ